MGLVSSDLSRRKAHSLWRPALTLVLGFRKVGAQIDYCSQGKRRLQDLALFALGLSARLLDSRGDGEEAFLKGLVREVEFREQRGTSSVMYRTTM